MATCFESCQHPQTRANSTIQANFKEQLFHHSPQEPIPQEPISMCESIITQPIILAPANITKNKEQKWPRRHIFQHYIPSKWQSSFASAYRSLFNSAGKVVLIEHVFTGH
jgi:hypothetical protein